MGKILRLNLDGTIPTGNPFFNTPGAGQAIWALGLHNPFRMAVDPITRGAFSLSGLYYFADFCSGFIRSFNPSKATAASFATAVPFGLTDLAFSPGQDLYYLFNGDGSSTRAFPERLPRNR